MPRAKCTELLYNATHTHTLTQTYINSHKTNKTKQLAYQQLGLTEKPEKKDEFLKEI